MRVNVCVNGTFRYPDYVRHYDEAGALGHFFFAHRRSRDAASLGLPAYRVTNVWAKHYGLAAAFRAAPDAVAAPLSDALCNAWQGSVVRRWVACDSVEAVIGATADRVIAAARNGGARILGHPVTAHPATVTDRVDGARADLGLPATAVRRADLARRRDEIAACDSLLVDSHLVARSYRAAGVHAPIHVVHPAFDRQRFPPRRADERDRRTPLTVCIGIVTPRKGQHVLLRAWRAARLAGARLVLVGAFGRDARAVLRGYEGVFTHVPHLDHAALRALLGRATCLVLPSAEDGFGQVALEAMASGVAPIISDGAGAAELVRHGQSGLVVPSGDAAALADALARLHADASAADAMGEAAARDAHGRGGWRPYVDRVLAIHRGLVAPRLEAPR